MMTCWPCIRSKTFGKGDRFIFSGLFSRASNKQNKSVTFSSNDLRRDPRFLTPDLRRQHDDELMAEIRAWMHTFRTFEELEAQVSGGGGLAVGRVRQPAEALESTWAEAMQPTYDVEVGGRTVRLPKGPWLFDGRDSGALPVAAAQGTHNREILREAGLDENTINALYERGVLHEALR